MYFARISQIHNSSQRTSTVCPSGNYEHAQGMNPVLTCMESVQCTGVYIAEYYHPQKIGGDLPARTDYGSLAQNITSQTRERLHWASSSSLMLNPTRHLFGLMGNIQGKMIQNHDTTIQCYSFLETKMINYD